MKQIILYVVQTLINVLFARGIHRKLNEYPAVKFLCSADGSTFASHFSPPLHALVEPQWLRLAMRHPTTSYSASCGEMVALVGKMMVARHSYSGRCTTGSGSSNGQKYNGFILVLTAIFFGIF